jgi:hypothetical protein
MSCDKLNVHEIRKYPSLFNKERIVITKAQVPTEMHTEREKSD